MMSKYIKIDDLRLHLQNLVLDGERLDPKTTRLIIMTLRELPIHEVEEESMKEGVEKNQFVEANKKGDCISRRQAIEAVTKTIRDKFSFDDWYEQLVETGLEIENLIKELPPVTPTERTGEWIDECENGHGFWVGICNQCGKERHVDNYCPNCGAKMKGGTENE